MHTHTDPNCRPNPMPFVYRCILPCILAWLAGCGQYVSIRGAVTDIRRDALPGVAVTVRGTTYEAVSDAVGRYHIRYLPPSSGRAGGAGISSLDLDFAKTGYAPTQQRIRITSQRSIEAAEAAMWLLPPGKGVYLYTGPNKYIETTRAEPELFLTKDGEALGIKKDPETETDDNTPYLMCHKMPSYDVRIHQLKQVPAAPRELATAGTPISETEFQESAWTAAAAIPVIMEAKDEPERLLQEIKLPSPLEPGVFAVHWGALDGHTSTDKRVFMFRVLDPNAPENPGESVQPDADPKETTP